jgi:hypothetical protein
VKFYSEKAAQGGEKGVHSLNWMYLTVNLIIDELVIVIGILGSANVG